MQRLSILLAAALLAGGCDDPPPMTDSGPPPQIDAGPTDPFPPTVRGTEPADGEEDVSRDTSLVVRFSEPMTLLEGRIQVEPGGTGLLATEGEWDESGSTLTIPPAGRWPSGEVTVTIETSFADEAGNTLAEPFVLQFVTEDDVAPSVTETTPAEGASGLSARLDSLEVRFDERMAQAGNIDILGGGGIASAPVWSEGDTVATFELSDLEYDRDYDFVLRGFRDLAGNRLDGEPVLGDGVVDISTGVDADAPQVVRSEPMEGQLDVNPAAQEEILITFDEPMDTSVTTVPFSDGTTTVDLSVEWTAQDRVLRADVRDLLEFETDYSLDLRGLSDRTGNALAQAPILDDGQLDFSVSADSFAPFVRASTPTEGAADVSYIETSSIELEFSEAMDLTVLDAVLVGGGASENLTGTWLDDTHFRVAIPDGFLRAATDYTLNIATLRDTLGNVVDTTHRYLVDGALDFRTDAPLGESCRDPLSIAEATFDSDAGTYEFVFGSGSVTERDGGTSACEGVSTTVRPDGLIRFDKTTPDLAGGGEYLHIVTSGSNNFTDFDVSVMVGGACDAERAPERCLQNSQFHDLWVDAPAGPVWIWIGRTSGNTFTTALTVTVEEAPGPRGEGESCEAPFTSSSATYTAPANPGDPHVWTVPENSLVSYDIGPSTVFDNSLVTCDPGVGHGIDGVIQFNKPDDASILEVTVDVEGSTTHNEVNVEVMSSCDATDVATSRYGCLPDESGDAGTFLVDAPAGDVFLWLTGEQTNIGRTTAVGDFYFPETIVSINLIENVLDGEFCSRALPLTAGANAVANTSARRLNPPSCFDEASDVEWYRLTTSEAVVIVGADVAGGVALVDPASGDEFVCSDDALSRPASRLLPPGSDLCVAVERGSSIGTLTVTEAAYSGLGANPPVQLNITRPLNTTGSEDSITGDDWMAVSSTSLIMQYTEAFSSSSNAEWVDAPITGNSRAVYRSTDTGDGIDNLNTGAIGVFVGDALFSFNDETGSTSHRLERVWGGTSAFWESTVWDQSPNYPTEQVGAATVVGDTIWFVTTDNSPRIYTISASAPGPALEVGGSDMIMDVGGIAVDDNFVYLAADTDPDGVEGIYRIPRTELTNFAFVPPNLTPNINIDSSSSATTVTPIFTDHPSTPGNLYVRNANGHIEVIIDPGGAPLYIGEVITLGGSGDIAAAFDQAAGSLYLFETDTVSTGNFVRFDP